MNMHEAKSGGEIPEAAQADFNADQKAELKEDLERLERLRDRWAKSEKKKPDWRKWYTIDWVQPIFFQLDQLKDLLGQTAKGKELAKKLELELTETRKKELKEAGEEPAPRQKRFLNEWREAVHKMQNVPHSKREEKGEVLFAQIGSEIQDYIDEIIWEVSRAIKE